jgi:hypothetical protein
MLVIIPKILNYWRFSLKLLLVIYSFLILSTSGDITNQNVPYTAPGKVKQEISSIETLIGGCIKAINENEEKLVGQDILYLTQEDIDKDGYNEIIIGTGIKGSNYIESLYDKIYILSNRENIELVDTIDDGYYISGVKIISLPDSSENYIYCGLTNAVNYDGFTINLFKDNQLSFVERSNGSIGSGFARVVDSDADGIIDRYIEFNCTSNVLFYETTRQYNWIAGKFELTDTDVYVRRYPETLKKLIDQYISLTLLDDGNSKDIIERLDTICLSTNTYDISKIDRSHVLNTSWEVEEGIEYDIVVEGNAGKVILSSFDSELQEVFNYTIEVIKIDDNWHIEDIYE